MFLGMVKRSWHITLTIDPLMMIGIMLLFLLQVKSHPRMIVRSMPNRKRA